LLLKSFNRKEWAWIFYDWANSAFATTVLAGFFPIFFKKFWSAGQNTTQTTYYLGLANSCTSLIIVFLAPLLGSIADRYSLKKKFLFVFCFLGVVMTAALFWVHHGHWQLAAIIYVFANLGFAGGNIFYDALIVDVSEKSKLDKLSSFGYAFGYLGGGILFALNVAMTLKPEFFDLANKTQAVQFSFLSVSIWWMLFALPLFFICEESQSAKDKVSFKQALLGGFHQLWQTLKKLKKNKNLRYFLFAYWFYIDGVNTLIKMSVDYGLSLGFEDKDLITALLLVQFIGFPAAVAFSKIADILCNKRGIFIGLFIYCFVCIWGYFVQETYEFYILAAMIGLVQGGVQSLSRSLYAQMIPKDQSAEYFSFYNMMGKTAAIMGPLVMGWVALTTGDNRLSILAISLLFFIGMAILSFVKKENQSNSQ